MKTVVFIHGAWHGGWCWGPLINELEQLEGGLALHAPSLLGMGERSAALTPALGLEEQVADVQAYIEDRNLSELTLVGHSFGGLIITGLADRIASRISHLVYLDALVPRSGESMATSGRLPLSAEEQTAIEDQFRALAPDGVAMAPLPPTAFGVPESHPQHDWVAANLSHHPLKTCLDPLILSGIEFEDLKRTYIACTSPRLDQPGVRVGAKRARSNPRWNYLEMSTGHDAMITEPAELAAILSGI